MNGSAGNEKYSPLQVDSEVMGAAVIHYQEEILEFAGYLLQIIRDLHPGARKIHFESGQVSVTIDDKDPYNRAPIQLATHTGRPPEEALKEYYGEDYAAIAPKRHAEGDGDK